MDADTFLGVSLRDLSSVAGSLPLVDFSFRGRKAEEEEKEKEEEERKRNVKMNIHKYNCGQ